jgi:hypothetical protein
MLAHSVVAYSVSSSISSHCFLMRLRLRWSVSLMLVPLGLFCLFRCRLFHSMYCRILLLVFVFICRVTLLFVCLLHAAFPFFIMSFELFSVRLVCICMFLIVYSYLFQFFQSRSHFLLLVQ